ncbi:hypothetical protein EO244_11870 [Ancylomarina salipaludis]|uniref:Carboxypeptidase-like regulatory domain-containing protein n=1 Tax=Ancylomarina salipaludis TaxID=2501299 RepID=A0A4Q1JL56_9BACT|nr:hypothetical protein [Ancylomarina salipaludis]RXQ92240.1 hypothetical protein EO244_11870 [Ancylomarina salipaludis]
MNTYNNLKLDSYAETNKTLTENQFRYETNVTTKAQADRFGISLSRLLSLREKIDQPTVWLTEVKAGLKKILINKLYPFSNALVCFANSKLDVKMLVLVNTSKSKLQREKEVDFIAFTNQCIELAKANLTELAAFSITESSLADLESVFNAYTQSRSDQILMKKDMKEAQESFTELMKETNSLLNKELDRSIENLRATEPEFVNHYFATRQKAKGVHYSYDLIGYLTDQATNQPVSLGSVKVEGLDMETEITSKGTFRFKTFPAGEQRLIIENINYKTLYVPIRRYASEKRRLNLKMEAIPLEIPLPVE